MTKKVLIITYFFPPRQAVASLRLKGIAKYLPEFGWEPVILTPKFNEDTDPVFNIIQTPYKGNLKELALRAFSEKILDNKILWEFIELPDSYKNWKKTAVKYATEYLTTNKVDAILSSSNPETTHIIARELKTKFKIPWLADMRDLWTMGHNYKKSKIRTYTEKLLEKSVLNTADAITTVSAPLVKIQSEFLNKNNVYSIENGFDPDEINHTDSVSNEFSFVYTGMIYDHYQKTDYLFKAIKDLIEDNLIDAELIKIKFFGPVSNSVRNCISKYNLDEVVTIYGNVSKEQSLLEQRKAQVLLSFNWEDKSQKGLYSGKIFEYLAAKRPILATSGFNDVVTDLLKVTYAGIHALSTEEIRKTILEYYHQYKTCGKVTYSGIDSEINKYSHIEMARKFSIILDQVTQKENND